MSDDLADLDQVIDRSRLALDAFFKGDPGPTEALYSHRDDASLANPFGPVVRGWTQIAATMARAAAHYRDGKATGVETVAKYVTAELAYTVEVEHYLAKVGGRDDVTPVSLRVTTVFRPEEGGWKIVHRHADPITTDRPAESVLQNSRARRSPGSSGAGDTSRISACGPG